MKILKSIITNTSILLLVALISYIVIYIEDGDVFCIFSDKHCQDVEVGGIHLGCQDAIDSAELVFCDFLGEVFYYKSEEGFCDEIWFFADSLLSLEEVELFKDLVEDKYRIRLKEKTSELKITSTNQINYEYTLKRRKYVDIVFSISLISVENKDEYLTAFIVKYESGYYHNFGYED